MINTRGGGKSQYAIKKLRGAWDVSPTSLMMCAGFMKFEDYYMIYTYRCKCKQEFEVSMSIKESQTKKIKCPVCFSSKVNRIITQAPQVQFKGSGFYINDKDKK